jgi:hypothetical protein
LGSLEVCYILQDSNTLVDKIIIIIMQEFKYRDITNVEPEMCDYTSNKWSHWNCNEKLKEKFGSCTRKTFDRFTTKEAILGTSHIIRKVLQCET